MVSHKLKKHIRFSLQFHIMDPFGLSLFLLKLKIETENTITK